jgi:hypothetical protein
MVQRSLRLIAVIGTKLQEDRVGNLLETQLEDLCMNLLDEAVQINIGLVEIEVSLWEDNRPILEDNVKD